MRRGAGDTEIEHQCHGCYMFHACLLLSGGDHCESLFSFRWYRRKRTAKAATVVLYFLCPGRTGYSIDAPSGEITNLLRAWSGGDEAALGRLAEHVYPELRLMARRYMKNERQGNTLQTTALVHEVYLRLVDVTKVEWQQRAQFFAMAAQMMRRILVDAARARGSHKRGGMAVKSEPR